MAASWYALHVKPHKEGPVYRLLQAEDVKVYYPVLKVEPVNPRSRKERPFFPGYMFVNLDLDEEGKNALRWTEGVYGLVRYGGEPAPVPQSLINEVERRLETLQAKGTFDTRQLRKGERVKIINGALEGYEAIFDVHLSGKDRVQVLLAYLNQPLKRLQLDSRQVVRVEDSFSDREQ